MVAAQTINYYSQVLPEPEQTLQQVKWSTVSLAEVLATGGRLEASVFNIEGRHARETLQHCKWPLKTIAGLNGFVSASHCKRFKRIYVDHSDFPIYQPSQINEIDPKPADYISGKTNTDISGLRVHKNQILMTCSGSIGNTTIVGDTLDNKIFSHDLLRIDVINKNEIGYVYAYLKSKTGLILVNTNNYGAVVSHIEPEHLAHIPIPDPSPIIKLQIHDLIMSSFRLRDESNTLMKEAQQILKSALNLPDISDIKSKYFNEFADFHNYSINISSLDDRMEASYHAPIVDSIEYLLTSNAKEVTALADSRVSKAIILPGRFKRVYVEEGHGVTFFGGKQILELDPSNKKYLSLAHHASRIKGELTLHEYMTLITCSGTIGKVNIVPKHWDGWTANQHIIRIVPANTSIAGYVYAWLASDYAYPLIHRFTYGAVVDEIDDFHVSALPFPFLNNTDTQKLINDKVLDANHKRFEAYELEQYALQIMDEKVIFAT
ncbi:MAG: restriction endonuclease subunit S [Syntrophaceae bacterium]|nr:restriction endonuclease subunit S [Syntrophaceae bacterium]